MNPRNAITFLRSPTGILLSFVVLLIFAIVFVKGFYDPNKGKPKTAAAPTPAEKTNRTSQILQTIQREIVPFRPPRTAPAAMLATSTGVQPQQINDGFMPISLYTEPPMSETVPKPPNFALAVAVMVSASPASTMI